MAISVISNIFQASANNRVKELGILKCVGGTRKQIKKTVISEGLWLSIAGIPTGLIAGTALGFLGVKIAGMYIDREWWQREACRCRERQSGRQWY